jgi:hypothetical protein
MQIVSTQQTVSARSRISDAVVITYTAEYQAGNPIDRINGRVLKDDTVAGYFSAGRTGESILSFTAGSSLTTEEKQEISSQIYTDEAEFFTEES